MTKTSTYHDDSNVALAPPVEVTYARSAHCAYIILANVVPVAKDYGLHIDHPPRLTIAALKHSCALCIAHFWFEILIHTKLHICNTAYNELINRRCRSILEQLAKLETPYRIDVLCGGLGGEKTKPFHLPFCTGCEYFVCRIKNLNRNWRTFVKFLDQFIYVHFGPTHS